jgi:hypothetical protein
MQRSRILAQLLAPTSGDLTSAWRLAPPNRAIQQSEPGGLVLSFASDTDAARRVVLPRVDLQPRPAAPAHRAGLTHLISAVIVISGAASELATGRNTSMTMQILYASLMALGIMISITVALTLIVEGASALWVRDQMRVLLERSRVTSPTRTPSTGAAQLKTATEDARVIVVR